MATWRSQASRRCYTIGSTFHNLANLHPASYDWSQPKPHQECSAVWWVWLVQYFFKNLPSHALTDSHEIWYTNVTYEDLQKMSLVAMVQTFCLFLYTYLSQLLLQLLTHNFTIIKNILKGLEIKKYYQKLFAKTKDVGKAKPQILTIRHETSRWNNFLIQDHSWMIHSVTDQHSPCSHGHLMKWPTPPLLWQEVTYLAAVFLFHCYLYRFQPVSRDTELVDAACFSQCWLLAGLCGHDRVANADASPFVHIWL